MRHFGVTGAPGDTFKLKVMPVYAPDLCNELQFLWCSVTELEHEMQSC